MLDLNPDKNVTFVPPSGNAVTAKLIIVGEQPGINEVRRGQPFIGASGDVLNSCLRAANIIRDECYITNTLKDLDEPLSAYVFAKTGAFTPAGQRRVEVLRDELNAIKTPFIIAAGNVALMALTSRTGVTKWRGSVLESTLCPGKWIIPVIHPATVVAPKFQYLNKHLITFDLVRANSIVEQGFYEPYDHTISIKPTFQDVLQHLDKASHQKIIAFDIEIVNEEVSCISVCFDLRHSMSIPFVDQFGDYFNSRQETIIWQSLAKLLENPNIIALGHNMCFDAHFMLRRYGIHTTNILDTMVGQQILSSDYPKGLDFVTSIHTKLPYYKDEGKRWFKLGGTWEQLWHYNGLDGLSCFIAYHNEIKEITIMENLPTFHRQCRIIEPLVYIMERGIKADVEGIKSAGEHMDIEMNKLQLELNTLAGQELNPNSPKQLKEYFYNKLSLHAYRKKGGGEITVDNDALKRLIRKGIPEAKLIQRIRKIKKARASYLELRKFDDDGRIRCSYNPAGTRFSRISSSANIFGTGMNMQNWPHELLKYLMCDDDYVGYAFDLSQAENRIVAYAGMVQSMIEAFENGIDVHSLTAALIFNKPISEVTREDGTCSLGDGTHSERFWGKKANHGLNYDLGYKSFAFYYEIPESEARFIVERYHAAYPGVRKSFHALVKQQLQANRTITNLMGRKTLFLDAWGPELFKDAYAGIPQGTTGDKINEHGVSYIYDNPQIFGPVELLSQVHDEIVFQIPAPWHPHNPVSWIDHARMVLLIKRSLETPLVAHGREFVIPADLTIFKLMKHGKELKRMPKSDQQLAPVLESTFKELLNVETPAS